MARLLFTALIASLLCTACVEIEPEAPTDADGEEIAVPDPGQPWLRVERIEPSDDRLADDSPIVIYFSDYLEDDSFRSYDFASLTSGGLGAGGVADYRMVDRAVVWQPRGTLEEGFRYELSINSDIESAVGSPFFGLESTPQFRIDEEADAPQIPELPDARWSDVEQIFEESCYECHGDEHKGLNRLDRDALVGKDSEQVDRVLVRPGDPADSYLMQKVLHDYADIRFTHQPPPWTDGEPGALSEEQLRVIEGWIKRGARR